jgi:hypothetical protein
VQRAICAVVVSNTVLVLVALQQAVIAAQSWCIEGSGALRDKAVFNHA